MTIPAARVPAHVSGGEAERLVPGTPHWDAQYPEHLQRYDLAARRMCPGARVLDAGCGVGYGSAHLAGRGAGSVIAVDLSEEALVLARRHFGDAGVRWVRDDCQVLGEVSADGPFDLIVNLENLEHLPEPERFLARAARMLAPDGVLVASVPDRIGVNRLRGLAPDAPSPNPFHFREYTAAEFRALLAPHFGEVTLSYQTTDPIERMDLEPALLALWLNPAVRAGRWIQRVLRRRPVTGQLDRLLPPRRYRIVDEDPGDARVLTLIAECRRPLASGV